MDHGSGRTTSIWMSERELPRFPQLAQGVTVDVCIIGGGIAGLSVAHALVGEGLSVLVLEDGPSIGSGETARTTAHLTNAYDDDYHELERLDG